LGSGRKTSCALIAVLSITALARAGWLYWDWNLHRQKASELLEAAQKVAAAEVLSAFYKNFELATKIAANLEFEKAFATRDKKGIARALDSIIKQQKAGNTSTTIVLQQEWSVFYASAHQGEEGLSLDPLNIPLSQRAISFEFPPGPQNPFPCGLCALTSKDKFALASLVPLKEDGDAVAVLTASTPFDSALLKNIEQKAKPLWSRQNNLGFASYIMAGASLAALSGDLQKSKPAYLTALTKVQRDPFEDRSAFTESDGRLWKNLPLWGPDGQHAMGQILICTTLAGMAFTDPLMLGAFAAALLLIIAVAMTSCKKA
jgi:hypothetical protein